MVSDDSMKNRSEKPVDNGTWLRHDSEKKKEGGAAAFYYLSIGFQHF